MVEGLARSPLGKSMENDALRGRSIARVGLMGAGNSTVGRPLAARLGLPFVDSDAEVEKTECLDVAELFERFGEAGFRAASARRSPACSTAPSASSPPAAALSWTNISAG